MRKQPHPEERGQVLALFAFGFLAFLAAFAFIIDGGNAYAQHRMSQNGSDAAAEAGAIVLAERLAGKTPTDAQVMAAIDGVLTAMDMDTSTSIAAYTDIQGAPLATSTTVGDLGSSPPPADAFGVEVTGDRPFDTFVAGALGMAEWNAVTSATAVAGYSTAINGPFLPFTPPVNIQIDCLNDNSPEWADVIDGEIPIWEQSETVGYVVPLCSTGPGNVGWLDYDPPNGGTSDLIDNIYPPPADPPSFGVPSWQWMVEAGNSAAGGIEDALRHYDGMVVLIPMHDATCEYIPADNPDGTNGLCPEGDEGNGTGKMVYHFPYLAAFQLCGPNDDGSVPAWCQIDPDGDGIDTNYAHGSYLSGANVTKECGMNKPGTGCLVGRFVTYLGPGNTTDFVVENPSPSAVIAIQLIK